MLHTSKSRIRDRPPLARTARLVSIFGEEALEGMVSEKATAGRRQAVEVCRIRRTLGTSNPFGGETGAGNVGGARDFLRGYHAHELMAGGREEPVFVHDRGRGRAGEQVFEAGRNVFPT